MAGSYRISKAHSLAATLLALSLPVACVVPVRASTVTVPDDFPTIQLALDSVADTVRIRVGQYPERPAVPRHKGLRIVHGLPHSGARPRLEGLIVEGPYGQLSVSGCAFTGSVDLYPGAGLSTVIFDSCDLDSGLIQHVQDTADYGTIHVLRSRIRGPVTMDAFSSVCEVDTFESCGMRVGSEASCGVSDCVFRGPGRAAIGLGTESSHYVFGNSIDGYTTGISAGRRQSTVVVADNRIEHCSEALSWDAAYGVARNNDIRDCGRGITGYCEGSLTVEGNRILGSTGSGIEFSLEATSSIAIRGNVVGRSGGDGIRVDFTGPAADGSGVVLKHNTSYRNHGAGFLVRALGGPYDLDLENNVALENGTYGIDADTSAAPDRCNDWFGNHGGATRGVTLSGTDLALDPLFCDVDNDSVTLAPDSPLLDAPGCGLIGALGQGCDSPTATEVGLFTAEPSPEGVRVRWQLLDPSRFAEVWIERSGAFLGPWEQIVTERSAEGDVTVGLDRSVLGGRDYWYRLVARRGGTAFAITEPVRVQVDGVRQFELTGAAPNPGSGPVRIKFALAREAAVELDVFDVQGRIIASLVHGALPAGEHVVEWAGRGQRGPAPMGLYLVRYRYPGGQQTLSLIRSR